MDIGQLIDAFEVKSRVLKSYLLAHFLILLATNWIMRNLITWEKHAILCSPWTQMIIISKVTASKAVFFSIHEHKDKILK